MGQNIIATMKFGGSSSGYAAISQAIEIIESANYITVDIVGLRRYHYEMALNKWNITDVTVNAGPSPASIIIISEDWTKTGIPKESSINLDLTNDQDAVITVVLSVVTTSNEYLTPAVFVKGPDDEQNQYEVPGQWYFDTDNNSLEIYIP